MEQGLSEVLKDDSTFLTSEEMAKVYKCPTSNAFIQRWQRDRRKPKELRTIPDPIQKRRAREYLWSPVVVRAALKGEKVAVHR